MSNPLALTRDINGFNAYGIAFCPDNYQTTLSSGVAQTLTVPSNFSRWVAIFSSTPGSNVWVADNVAATTPGGSFAQTASQLNPAVREVAAGDVLSLITDDTSTVDVCVSFYAITQL
jgi:hypothetical protein